VNIKVSRAKVKKSDIISLLKTMESGFIPPVTDPYYGVWSDEMEQELLKIGIKKNKIVRF